MWKLGAKDPGGKSYHVNKLAFNEFVIFFAMVD